jgi:hypothetical protein
VRPVSVPVVGEEEPGGQLSVQGRKGGKGEVPKAESKERVVVSTERTIAFLLLFASSLLLVHKRER